MSQYKIKGLAPSSSPNEYRIKGLANQNKTIDDSQQQGISDIPGDLGSLMTNLFLGAGEKAMDLPSEITDAGKQFYEHPIATPPRAARGILGGLLEGGKQAFNLPLNINTYLGSKGVPPFKQTMGLAEKLKIGDTGLQNAVMGKHQPGDELFQDIGQLGSLIYAPETMGVKIPAVTSKGIMKQLSKQKSIELNKAKTEYNNLFQNAADEGFTHAVPLKVITNNKENIIKNSQPKYHTAFKKYLAEPTIENAHWAQSELGALKRHLENISNKTGLTPTQIKTHKAVMDAQKGIKESMFSKNSFGGNPKLASDYTNLGKKYRENVIPYTSLEDLSETEAGKLRPKTAVKNLLKDEQFMINLAKKNPGIYLHTPYAKNGLFGLMGLAGYDEIKKLINKF